MPSDAIVIRREGAKSDHERALWRCVARPLGAAAAVAAVVLKMTVLREGSGGP